MSRCLLPLCLLACVACSGAGLEFADWTIPVAEGTPVFGYAAVPFEERGGEIIDTEYDLVLGADLSDPEQVFYDVTGVVPDPDGNIWINDRGNRRVQVFDPSGAYLRSVGQEGQGPGEFESPLYPVIAGGHFLVRAQSRRLSLWTLDGEHVRDTQLMKSLSQFTGIDEGFVARYSTPVQEEDGAGNGPARQVYTYSLFDLEAQELRTYAEVLQPAPEMMDLGGGETVFFGSGGFISSWTMRFALSPDGVLYLTTSKEYELHAYGSQPWALRVAGPHAAVRQEHRDAVMSSVRKTFPDAVESGLKWQDEFQAIVNVEVDGHGHVYVFPFFPPLNAPIGSDQERPQVDRPVDVYSAGGEHLFSGMISISSWTGALGDHVYRPRLNPDTDELEVVRIRLVEPF